ncbi:MAG: glycosyl transferase family 1, partial [Alphaproteobacteria bacterium]
MRKDMKHVCIVSGDHLWLNPRVVKEADALAKAGFRVTVVGPTLTKHERARDQTILATRNWRRIAAPDLLKGGPSAPKRFLARLFRRLSIIAVTRLRLQMAGSLGYGIAQTLRATVAVNADIYSCHLEVGLLVLRRLTHMGRPCAFDFEDWYSRDLRPEAQRSKPMALLAKLERQAMNEAEFTTTTSSALAAALVAAYGGTKPLVVFNAFEKDEGPLAESGSPDRRLKTRPSLHWYSLNIGRGRGLELLFDAVELLKHDFELHVRGEGSADYKNELLQRLSPKTRERVFFHPTVDPAQLRVRIAEHDIGFALEASTPPSRDLTITNKVFQYLQ